MKRNCLICDLWKKKHSSLTRIRLDQFWNKFRIFDSLCPFCFWKLKQVWRRIIMNLKIKLKIRNLTSAVNWYIKFSSTRFIFKKSSSEKTLEINRMKKLSERFTHFLVHYFPWWHFILFYSDKTGRWNHFYKLTTTQTVGMEIDWKDILFLLI